MTDSKSSLIVPQISSALTRSWPYKCVEIISYHKIHYLAKFYYQKSWCNTFYQKVNLLDQMLCHLSVWSSKERRSAACSSSLLEATLADTSVTHQNLQLNCCQSSLTSKNIVWNRWFLYSILHSAISKSAIQPLQLQKNGSYVSAVHEREQISLEVQADFFLTYTDCPKVPKQKGHSFLRYHFSILHVGCINGFSLYRVSLLIQQIHHKLHFRFHQLLWPLFCFYKLQCSFGQQSSFFWYCRRVLLRANWKSVCDKTPLFELSLSDLISFWEGGTLFLKCKFRPAGMKWCPQNFSQTSPCDSSYSEDSRDWTVAFSAKTSTQAGR